MVKITSSIPILAMVAICWLVPAGVVAKERPWFKYENAYFEAYSDASERKVRRLLKELENFRAAVIQTLNIQAPNDYVKTQVIIIDSRSDFKEIASAAYIAAYMQRIDGIPHIVMPDSHMTMDAEALIRHEYAHVLLDFNRFDYPWWFEEGFAEFVSSVDFRKKDSQFRLGDQPQRAKHWDGGTMPWDELVTYEGIIDDQEVELRTLSNAYLQSWILVHHVLLGHEFTHVGQIAEYFYYDSNGEPSNIAFEKAFRVSPEEMGKPLMKKRGTKIDVYTFEFLSTFRDPEFTRAEMPREQAASMLETLRAARAQ